MKNSKKGISLIVLVITIIVIIILAAAVILTLNNNNPINNSKQATFDSDVAEVKSAVTMYVANFMAKNPAHDSPFNPNTANDWIVIGGEESADAVYADTANGTTTYGPSVSWKALGLNSKPASIKEIHFNCETGTVRAVPSQLNVEFVVDADTTYTNTSTLPTADNNAGGTAASAQ